jgi:hypothetical protein
MLTNPGYKEKIFLCCGSQNCPNEGQTVVDGFGVTEFGQGMNNVLSKVGTVHFRCREQ